MKKAMLILTGVSALLVLLIALFAFPRIETQPKELGADVKFNILNAQFSLTDINGDLLTGSEVHINDVVVNVELPMWYGHPLTISELQKSIASLTFDVPNNPVVFNYAQGDYAFVELGDVYINGNVLTYNDVSYTGKWSSVYNFATSQEVLKDFDIDGVFALNGLEIENHITYSALTKASKFSTVLDFDFFALPLSSIYTYLSNERPKIFDGDYQVGDIVKAFVDVFVTYPAWIIQHVTLPLQFYGGVIIS